MIEVNGLVKQYGQKRAVDKISFTIKDGEVVGFLGPNGAGKSTTMNIITGYLSASEGTILVDGLNVLDEPMDVRRRIGYLPEQPPLYLDMTVMEYLNFVYELKGAKAPREEHLNEVCEMVGIDNVSHRIIKNLSKGYKQRVGLAQALIGNPDVLILDEPTVGLDPKQIIDIRNMIKDLGKSRTVILSSHILPEIQAICERVLVINNGQIVADDTPENLSSTLSNGHRLALRILGESDDVLAALSAIEGIKNAEALEEKEPGAFDYIIEVKQNEDVRKAISQKLSEKNLPILLMKPLDLSLEDIFLKLTTEEVSEDVENNPDLSNGEEEVG
ncbi:MAG: ABC transporter ATP-binding protein [Clostridiales bacterium]|nr:ABC transporter ATP-binding protein [Clostridiales bacterium]